MDDFNPDDFIASQTASEPELQVIPASVESSAPVTSGLEPEVFNPDAFIQEQREAEYGTIGQQAATAVEGVAEGLAGPLATLAETKLLGIPEEDILARREVNPITHGTGQVGGLGLGLLTGTGEAALMVKAGQAAQKALKLGEATRFGAKVGSTAVQQAAEMAILQGSDEVSKLILNDPNTSAESAISNIGLAAALGGAGGAFLTGAVNPLWNATAGPKVEQVLTGLKDYMNGNARLVLPETVAQAEKSLGIELPSVMKAGMSGNDKAALLFNELREVQHPAIMQGIEQLKKETTEAVLKKLKIDPADIANYSENNAGHELINTFKKEYDNLYAPVQRKYDALKETNASISIPDEARLMEYAKIIEKGQQFGAQGSPYQKLFDQYGERLLAQDTIGQTDKLLTELNGELKKAFRAGDSNTATALRDIKSSIQQFQENQILKQARNLEKEGAEFATAIGKDIISGRQQASKEYARIAKISDEMSGYMGLGEFKGVKHLLQKLADKKSPEQILKALSPKGDADLLKFLGEHFPQTLEKIKENELKQLVRPAVLAAKGEESINLNTLSNAVEKGLAGKEEYIKSILGPEALEAIQAGRTITSAIPGFKSSGTAGWLTKLMSSVPPSALAAVSFVTGKSPIAGYLTGAVAQLMGREAPDAVKLGLLKFLASDQPVKADGFKAMVEFFHNVYKGENAVKQSIKNVLKPGAQVVATHLIPDEKDRNKLDKIVDKIQDNPNSMFRVAGGHTGHYLPTHQESLAQVSTQAIKYLQSLKPRPYKASPLDREIEPTPAQKARYERALDIAQTPTVVLDKVKQGTIQISDIQDLNGMYPGLYKQFSQKLSHAIVDYQAAGEPIPYKTRMGLSLFLGQPMDTSMTPQSIISAQPKPTPMPPQGQAQGGNPKRSTKALSKLPKTYMTKTQAAEVDKD